MSPVFLMIVACLLSVDLSSGSISVCPEPLQLGESYTIPVNISSPQSLCYILDSETQCQALRWHGSADGALIQHPVLVTVRQPRGVSSLSLPFLENGYAHHEVHRILCPLLNADIGSSPGESRLLIDLTTSSLDIINFTFELEQVESYQLELNKPQTLLSSPSSPSFMVFEFPEDLNHVSVKVSASEETRNICAIASIQNVYCPEVELQDNKNDRGKFQTMTSLAYFKLNKDDERNKFNFFYVVVSVMASNGPSGDCILADNNEDEGRIGLGQAAVDYNPAFFTGKLSRVKNLTITVEPGMSTGTYVMALGLLTGVMLFFFVFAFFWILLFEWLFYKRSTLAEVHEEAGHIDEIISEALSMLGGDPPHTEPYEEPKLPSLISILFGKHWKDEKDKVTLRRRETLRSLPSSPTEQPTKANMEWRSLRNRKESILALGEKSEPLQEEQEYKYDKPPFPVHVYMSEVGKIDERQSAYDYYPHYVLVILIFYSLPVFQLLDGYLLITSHGNEDICYYNYLCANPVVAFGFDMHAFNNIFSNIGFFAMGVLLIYVTFRRRALYQLYTEINLGRPRDKKIGVPHQFGIYYAIGVGMMGQAVLSSAYHMCPTKDTIRFDATFICIQTGIAVHKFLQVRVPDKSAILHEIMLLFAGLMLSISLGMMNSESLYFWVPFSASYVIATVIFAVQIYYRWEINSLERVKELWEFWMREGVFPPRHKTKFVHSVATLVLNLLLIWLGFSVLYTEFSNFIVYVLLGNDILHLIAYVLSKIAHKEKTHAIRVGAFAVLTVVCWVLATYFYTREITNWSTSPALSRDKNTACSWFGFYDSHDAWHIMAGFAIFFTSMLFMSVDDGIERQTRDKIITL